MRLSAPLYRLKRLARILSRDEKIPLNRALDRIASMEGVSSWSLLAAQARTTTPSREMLAQLSPGDLVLLGARPGHGKTLLSLELIAEAMEQGHRGIFFTLEYTANDVLDHLRTMCVNLKKFDDLFEFDDSDSISSDYMEDRLAMARRGTVVVVDYLQLLDQKRENPPLSVQVHALKSLAEKLGLIIVLISQIDRSFELSEKTFPDLEDVRLPNPLDLTVFSKTCFVNNGQMRISRTC